MRVPRSPVLLAVSAAIAAVVACMSAASGWADAPASPPSQATLYNSALQEGGAAETPAGQTTKTSGGFSTLYLTPAEAAEAWTVGNCKSSLVLCIDPAGNLVIDPDNSNSDAGDPESVPTPETGDHVVVRVLGRSRDLAGRQLNLMLEGDPHTASQTFPGGADGGVGDAGAACPSDSDAAPPECKVTRLLELPFTMPDQPTAVIDYKSGPPNANPDLVKSYVLTRSQTESFHFEGALFVPFVFNGNRTIGTVPIPSSSDQALHVHNDLHATFGLSLNYFPWGISGHGSWTRAPDKGSGPFQTFVHYVLSPLGAQVGTTFDFSSSTFREWYLGLAYEPIRGGSLDFGIAFLQGQFLAPGFSEGMLVPNGQIPAGAIVTSYMFRPYVGVTLSPEILTTLLGAFQSIQTLGHQAKTESTE